MQLHFSGLCVLVMTLLRVNPALWKFIRLTFTSFTDVDECKDDRHDCHVNGTCTNTAGSFECVCNDGYLGDGRNCSGSHPDPEINKDPISQKNISALQTSVWSKNKDGGREGRGVPRGPATGSATELRPQFPLTKLLTLVNHIAQWTESERSR